jgi:hypothetical protein
MSALACYRQLRPVSEDKPMACQALEVYMYNLGTGGNQGCGRVRHTPEFA